MVIGISRSPEPHPVFLPYKKRQDAPFDFSNAISIAIFAGIMALIEDSVLIISSTLPPRAWSPESWQNPEHWFQTNVVSTVKFHEQLRKCDFLKKYVHVSTPEVYGTCEGSSGRRQIIAPDTLCRFPCRRRYEPHELF